ncbi:UNVERIFIED_CONTAM: hypothetical protein GTU68_063794 [Idotea baltica]|nr:hypothetical protein [Idotea baltica]
MAKKSKIAKNNKRIAMVERFAPVRKALKATIADQNLAKLPRDSNKIRIRNRCELTGRPRGYIRKFGLSRMAFREKALLGELPGVTKSSW